MGFTVNGTFKIQKNNALSGADYLNLAQMYLPLIGIDGFGLYHYLCILNDRDTFDFKRLLDYLNFPTVSYLDQSFAKLEALALVDTYYNRQKDAYVFKINTPLARENFLSSPLLSSFLRIQVGEIEFDKISAGGRYITRSYQNVTRPFDKVYTVTEQDTKNMFSKLLSVKTSDKLVKVHYDEFDYIFFKLSFNTDFIDAKLLDDDEFKQNILNIAFMYKLNEEDMIELIKKTITVNKDLKYEDLSRNASAMFQKKYKTAEPRFVTKQADVFLDSATDDNTYRFLEKIDNMAPADLLEELSGIKPSVSELKMIEELINNTKFSLGIINIMLLWINNEKSGEIPGYNYFEKIANTWARANIKTSFDALQYINREEKRKAEQPVYQKGKKTVELPSWYSKYQEQLSNLPKPEAMSPEETENILSKMKKNPN